MVDLRRGMTLLGNFSKTVKLISMYILKTPEDKRPVTLATGPRHDLNADPRRHPFLIDLLGLVD